MAEVRWSVCIWKSTRFLSVSFLGMDSGMSTYHLFVCSNSDFLHNSQGITLPTQSCLVLNSYMLICCIHLLCDWSFRLYRHIVYIGYFVASCLFLHMALFCATIKRDLVSLVRFPFLSHVQIFSCEISLVCRLKCLHSCLFSHFCFQVIFALLILVLSILFPVVVISLPLCIYASTLFWMKASPLPPSFLSTFSLWRLSLRCKVLRIAMSFLFLWSICWSFSVVHFKNGPEYVTRGTAQALSIPLMRLLLYSLVSSSFLLRYFFVFFFLSYPHV